jgi:hypothetical protein
VDANEVNELAGAMGKAGGGASGGAMGEVEVDLHDALAGADGVDRHADLHAEAGGKRQNVK